MLVDTLVIWGRKFGRTPMGENRKAVGRDRHFEAPTMWVAEAGLKSGYIDGQSDEIGLEYGQPTYRSQGRNFRLTDLHGEILQQILAQPKAPYMEKLWFPRRGPKS